ncbi:substrate-binding periplasmic protein [Algicola sagamiensis]|uniref:substrate-binding periplasmic protein n=1 Tax=Algicola sagamiensis TaxID=163869 RepID=UPI000A06CD33|nr:transporter substrate-binding domain-containing protein [Algicola sagamiensis]
MKHMLLAVICSAFAMLSMQVNAETIKISASEYAPFTTAKANHGGFVNRVIKEAFKRKGVTVEFVYYPWKRALEDGRAGKVAGVSFSFTNPERKKDFVFSDKVSDHREVLFHKKGKVIPEWANIEDLGAFKFGATRGYTYTKEFWAAAKAGKIKVSETPSDEQSFKKLAAGRIDLFPMDEITGWDLLKNKLSTIKETLTTHGKPLRSTTGHLILSKKAGNHADLLKKFNEGLAEIRKDGTYKKFEDDLFAGNF